MAPGPMGHGSLGLLRLYPVAATLASVSSAARSGQWTQSEPKPPGPAHWSCWSYWIPVREKPFVIVVVELEAASHQVEAVDPAQGVGARGEARCNPLSGRVDDAPTALTERGAPSLGFRGPHPANGFFFGPPLCHRPALESCL